MERVYSNYLEWEDFKAGMYGSEKVENQNRLLNSCVELLSSTKLRVKMLEVLDKWPICTEFNLTNSSSNRNAWLGRAVCCLHLQAPQYITRIAWFMVSIENRTQANKVATSIIENWCKNYNSQKVYQLCLKLI